MTEAATEPMTVGRGTVWAIIATTAVAATVLLTAPVLVGEMIRGLGLEPDQAGYVISVELGGMALATLPAYYWLGRVPVSRVLWIILAVYIVGNLLTALYTLGDVRLPLLLALRFMVALAAGTVMVICMTAIRLYRQPDRLYGLWTLGQLVLGAIGVAALPPLFAHTGIAVFYGLIAALMALTLPLVRHFPERLSAAAPRAAAGAQRNWLLPALCLGGIFVFYVSLGGMWTYMERIGAAAGLAPATIGYTLSFATALGILGAATAAWLGGGRIGLSRPVSGGLALLSLSILLLWGEQSLVSYMVATGIFKYCWTFALPFLLGCVARIDLTGRLVTSTNLLIGGGTAAGPALAAAMIGPDASYDAVVLLFLCTSLVSFALMSYSALVISRPG